jgi:hypothetical protein
VRAHHAAIVFTGGGGGRPNGGDPEVIGAVGGEPRVVGSVAVANGGEPILGSVAVANGDEPEVVGVVAVANAGERAAQGDDDLTVSSDSSTEEVLRRWTASAVATPARSGSPHATPRRSPRLNRTPRSASPRRSPRIKKKSVSTAARKVTATASSRPAPATASSKPRASANAPSKPRASGASRSATQAGLTSPKSVAPKKAKSSAGASVLAVHQAFREEAELRRREHQAECTRHNRTMEGLEERRVSVLEAAERIKMQSTNMNFEMEQLLKYQALVDQFGGVYTAAEMKEKMKSLAHLVRDEDFLP